MHIYIYMHMYAYVTMLAGREAARLHEVSLCRKVRVRVRVRVRVGVRVGVSRMLRERRLKFG